MIDVAVGIPTVRSGVVGPFFQAVKRAGETVDELQTIFDARLGHEYYALRRGDPSRLDERLSDLDEALEAQPYLSGREYGLADIGYLPWILRARTNLGVDLEPCTSLSAWLERLSERPAVAAELELTAALGR